MCGIAGVYIRNPDILNNGRAEQLEKFIDHLLLGIESRGRDSTGILAIDDKGKGIVWKDALTATEFVNIRNKFPENTRMVLAHTRAATKGSPTKNENNHPVKYNNVYVTHNGMIRNDDELFKSLDMERGAEVDTEIISAVLDKYGMDSVPEALKDLKGGFAIAAFDIRKPTHMLLAKGDSFPLVYYDRDDWIVWSSLSSVIKDSWEKAIGTIPAKFHADIEYLKAGEALMLTPEGNTKIEFEVEPSYYTNGQTNFRGRPSYSFLGWDDFGDFNDDDDIDFSYISSEWQKGFKTNKALTEVCNTKDEVAKLVETGDNKAITWDTKEIGRSYSWKTCLHCQRLLNEKSFVHSSKWGSACCDCVGILAKRDRMNNLETSVTNNASLYENIAAIEAIVHKEALEIAAKKAMVTVETAEWILFRAKSSIGQILPDINSVWDVLEREYGEYYSSAWEEWSLDETFDAMIIGKIEEDNICSAGEDDAAPLGFGVPAPKHCCRCMKDTVMVLNGFGWCSRHKYKCSGSRRCKKPTIGWSVETGERYCEKHRYRPIGIFFTDEMA